MVSADDFISNHYVDPIDCAILRFLYYSRNREPLSAREITQSLKPSLSSESWKKEMKEKSPERSMRNHLAKLRLSGDLQMNIREPTGEKGRAPEVYHLSEGFKVRVEEYLNIKEMALAIGKVATVRCLDGHIDPAKCNPKLCQREDCRKRSDYLKTQV